MPTFLERLNSAHGGNLEDTIALCQLIVESEGRVKELRGCVPTVLFQDLIVLYLHANVRVNSLWDHLALICGMSDELASLCQGVSFRDVYNEVFNVYRR